MLTQLIRKDVKQINLTGRYHIIIQRIVTQYKCDHGICTDNMHCLYTTICNLCNFLAG